MKSKSLLVATLLCGVFGVLSLQAQIPYKIKGTWQGGEGEKIYLKEIVSSDSIVLIDSTLVSKDCFEFNGKVDEMKRMELSCKPGKQKILIDGTLIMADIVDKPDTVKGKPRIIKALQISGSPEQKVMEETNKYVFMSAIMQLGEMFSLSHAMEGTDSLKMRHDVDSIQNIFNKVKESMDKDITNYLDSTRDSYAITYFIDEYIGKYKPFNVLKQCYDNLTDRVKASTCGRALKARVDALGNASVGGMAPNIEFLTPDGKTLSLYSLRGHIVLLDFWASWCGPCLREMPNVKNIYAKYHSKGLEVLGVSLDEKADAWKNAITNKELNWKHISSLEGWKCPAAKIYNVTAIPRMYIIDETGKIIAQDLRGEKLVEKMDELFKGK